MSKFWKPVPVYVKLSFDKMELTNLNTNETKTRNSIEGFSSQRLLLANFNNAELLLRSILDEFTNRKYLKPSYNMIIQQLEKLEGGMSEVEERALWDLAHQSGAKAVIVLDHSRILTNAEALMLIDDM